MQPLLTEPGALTPLFPNRKGESLRPGNVRRILQSFRDEWADDLATHGIEGERVSPHLLRQTVATMLATERGVDRAKEQLGHASVQTTERHYLAPPRLVGTTTVALLDELLARPSHGVEGLFHCQAAASGKPELRGQSGAPMQGKNRSIRSQRAPVAPRPPPA